MSQAQRIWRFAHDAMATTFEIVIAGPGDGSTGPAPGGPRFVVAGGPPGGPRSDAAPGPDEAGPSGTAEGDCAPPGGPRFVVAAARTDPTKRVHPDAAYARQAAQAAFDEADRLEGELSRFIPTSEIAQINAAAVGLPVRVGIAAWDCLLLARRLWVETAGAFDVTLGAGMDLLALDPAERTVTRLGDGVAVDLGGIGKGFAVDAMVAVLADWSIASALLHAGQSTVFAMGTAPDRTAADGPVRATCHSPLHGRVWDSRPRLSADREAIGTRPSTASTAEGGGATPGGPRFVVAGGPNEAGWPVAIRDPADDAHSLGTVRLRGRALSGSGVRIRGRHILDPRTGRPVQGRAGAWALAPSAAESDALSTAFMVMTAAEVARYCGHHSDVEGMLLDDGPELRLLRFGR